MLNYLERRKLKKKIMSRFVFNKHINLFQIKNIIKKKKKSYKIKQVSYCKRFQLLKLLLLLLLTINKNECLKLFIIIFFHAL
jgi:hypothetical protein